MEIDPRYVEVTIRWQKHSGKDAILESTGQVFDDIAERQASRLADQPAPAPPKKMKQHAQR